MTQMRLYDIRVTVERIQVRHQMSELAVGVHERVGAVLPGSRCGRLPLAELDPGEEQCPILGHGTGILQPAAVLLIDVSGVRLQDEIDKWTTELRARANVDIYAWR